MVLRGRFSTVACFSTRFNEEGSVRKGSSCLKGKSLIPLFFELVLSCRYGRRIPKRLDSHCPGNDGGGGRTFGPTERGSGNEKRVG